MRQILLILPFILAANPVSAEHDRHHRSVPRVKAEVRLETPASGPSTAPAIQASAIAPDVSATAERPAGRPPVRVVLPSPFAR